MSSSFKTKLLASTLLCGICAVAGRAQTVGDPAPATAPVPQESVAASDDALETAIIVTGSRIARPDLEAASPVAVLSGDALRQNNAVTVEQLLQVNPQFVSGLTSASNNPGDGSATVDLRGLGSNRTLVLIDGKRAPPYDSSGAVDVNTIPTALIKRIDILTGGASAVYGSDAISGVVNFVLDDRFTGLRADGSSQISGYGDGQQFDVSLTGGIKLGDRGNLVVSGGYSKRDGIKYGARPHNSNAVDSSDLVTSAGSLNTVPTVFDTGQGSLQVTDTGALTDAIQLYNFTPVNYAQVPFERYNVMALGRYDITDGVEAYARGNYSHVDVVTTLAPTATAGFAFNIDPTNPFLTEGERAVFFDPATATINDGSGVADDPTARAGTSVVGIRRRIIETGGRIEEHNTKAWQLVGGLRGALGNGFRWDVFGQYGEVKRHEVLRNDLSYTALAQALDVVSGPNGPQCFDQSNGCVPLNLFTTGTIPQDQLSFVLRDALQDSKTTQVVAGGNLSGDLGFAQSPWASHPAAFSVGVEYRRETARTDVDPLFASGDLIYYGQGQNIRGSYDTKEIYGELRVPLVQDRPFFNALDVEAGVRYSDYSTVGGVWTYKGGGSWSPVAGARFRGIYQRAVRAPNIFELYSPVVAGTGSLSNDPCAKNNVVSAALQAICIAQGAPASAFPGGGVSTIPVPISGQINIFTGGNPNLDAEKSDTFTVGLVLTPPQLPRFSFTIDYYNINIANAISTTPPFITADLCYNSGAGPTSAACSGIKRNTLTGSLSGNTDFGVPSVLGNVAALKTDGIDVSASYRGGDAEGFSYGLYFSGTYTRNYTQQADPTAAPVQCAGFFGSACNLEPIPKWKHVADVNLGYGKFNLLTRWRFLGKVKQDIGTDILRSEIPAFTYIDTTLSFAVNEQFNMRFGIQNLFDKKSPIVGDTVGADANAGSTFPNTYDVIGRTFFVSASAKF